MLYVMWSFIKQIKFTYKQFTGNFHAYSIENIDRYIWIMFIVIFTIIYFIKTY